MKDVVTFWLDDESGSAVMAEFPQFITIDGMAGCRKVEMNLTRKEQKRISEICGHKVYFERKADYAINRR